MRTTKSILTAVLLASMSTAAQQAAPQTSAQPTAPDATPTAQAQPSQQPAPATAKTADTQAPQSAPAATPIPLPAAAPAPTTMDQVVNLFIQREHGLIKMLAARNPVVETYLQNLTSDPQLGPVPSGDHYFLGRLDMGETIDRKDYLKDEEKGGMQSRLLGGFQKLYKVQYQPMGFSWMVYADRTDFDREHYDFHYSRREFLCDVRCLVFDGTPKPKSGRGRFLGP